MSLFEDVKENVTTREAAQQYGLQMAHNGMCICPFHTDTNPSLKVDVRYHCFGCQADGDVIDFTARLFDLSAWDAARKLAADFGISQDQQSFAHTRPKMREPTEAEYMVQSIHHCYSVLADYRNLLVEWQTAYAPASSDEAWHPRFTEALAYLAATESQLDTLLDGSPAEKQQVLCEQSATLPVLEKRIQAIHQKAPPSIRSALTQPCRCGESKPSKTHKEVYQWNL